MRKQFTIASCFALRWKIHHLLLLKSKNSLQRCGWFILIFTPCYSIQQQPVIGHDAPISLCVCSGVSAVVAAEEVRFNWFSASLSLLFSFICLFFKINPMSSTNAGLSLCTRSTFSVVEALDPCLVQGMCERGQSDTRGRSTSVVLN